MRQTEPDLIAAPGGVWSIEPRTSRVELVLLHGACELLRGRLGEVSGTLRIDDRDPGGLAAEIAVDASAVEVSHPAGRTRLLAADLFGPSVSPTVRFASRVVQPAGEGRLRVFGKLVFGGAVRMLTLDVQPRERLADPAGGERLRLWAVTTLALDDGAVPWSRLLAHGIPRGDEIAVGMELEAVRSIIPAGAA